jgi:hypothetical protein
LPPKGAAQVTAVTAKLGAECLGADAVGRAAKTLVFYRAEGRRRR